MGMGRSTYLALIITSADHDFDTYRILIATCLIYIPWMTEAQVQKVQSLDSLSEILNDLPPPGPRYY